MKLQGAYVGVVRSNQDPQKLGRVKVGISAIYGSGGALGALGTDDIPWAIPAALPAGGTIASGGVDWLPEPGDQVLVFFLDGEPEKPVWLWLMQTLNQAGSFPVHNYDQGKPNRGALTRYGHSLEINSGSIIESTKNGYQITLLDGTSSTGKIQIATPSNQYFEFDDTTNGATLNVNEDFYLMAGSDYTAMSAGLYFTTTSRSMSFKSSDQWETTAATSASLTSGTDMTLNAGTDMTFSAGTDMNLTSTASLTASGVDVSIDASGDLALSSGGACSMSGISFNAAVGVTLSLTCGTVMQMGFTNLLLGTQADEPFVLGNQLVTLFNMLTVWLDSHTHSNGNNGQPTGVPIDPSSSVTSSQLGSILSDSIMGQ